MDKMDVLSNNNETSTLLSNDDFLSQKVESSSIPPTESKRKKTNSFVYILTFFSAIGGFLFGYDTGVVSGAMILIKQEFSLNNMWQELIVSITVGFAAIFALFGGYLNTCFGRRPVIIVASVIFLLGSVELAMSENKEMLLVGRAIVGAGIGLTSMTVPMYIAEVSPTHIRGRLVTINNIFITGGQFIASCVDGVFSINKVDGWRYMLGLAAIPAFVQFVGFLFLPESPRWLMQKGKNDKALKSFHKILADEAEEEKEFQAMKKAVTEEMRQQHGGGLIQALKDPSVRRALFVGCGLQMFQQLSGINTVMYYSATIVQMSGIRNATVAIWLAAATAFTNFAFTFVGLWLVEKMGRRLLSLCSIAGVTLSLLFLSASFYISAIHSPVVTINSTEYANGSTCARYMSCDSCIKASECGYCYVQVNQVWNVTNSSCLPTNTNYPQISETGDCSTKNQKEYYFATNYCPTPYSWMAMIGMILYLAFFAPGMGPMPWTINSEIYPQWARSIGNAFSTTTNWVFNVIVAVSFLDVMQWLTVQGAFLLYAGLAFLGFLFILLFLPETKGKPLEEIQGLFEAGWLVPCRKEKAYHVILNGNQNGDETDEDTLFTR